MRRKAKGRFESTKPEGLDFQEICDHRIGTMCVEPSRYPKLVRCSGCGKIIEMAGVKE
jgi:hypothetical protein